MKEDFEKIDEDDYYEKRLEICNNCPLGLSTPSGLICNHNLWISLADKTTISETRKPGYIRGCSCNITRKAKISFAKCIVDKW